MSNETDSSFTPEPTGGGRLYLFAIGFLVAINGPLLWLHILQLWGKPHYQFVVFAPIAALILWFDRQRDAPVIEPGASVFVYPMLLASLAGLGLASVLGSPWLAMVAMVVVVITALLGTGGFRFLFHMTPVWVILALMIPLPLGWDDRLMRKLRTVATFWSSRLLDSLNLLHSATGNIVEIPGRKLFVDDACSGIHSLFVSLAFAVFLTCWARRGLLHSVLLVISSIWWVLVENVLRVTAVAYLAAHGYPGVIEGWPHELLGLVLFVMTLGLIASTDQLLLYFLPDQLFARILGLLGKRPAGFDRAAKGVFSLPPIGSTWLGKPLILALFLAPAVVQYWLSFGEVAQASQAAANYRLLEFDQFGKSALPETIAGWKLEDYYFERRSREDPFGEFSQIWDYRLGGVRALISLDYSYKDIHELDVCYEAGGWAIEQKTAAPVSGPQGDYVELDISKSLHGNGRVLFSVVDSQGTLTTPGNVGQAVGGQVSDRFSDRLAALTGKAVARRQEDRGPYFQVQLFHRSAGVIQDREREATRTLFLAVRPLILDLCQKNLVKEKK